MRNFKLAVVNGNRASVTEFFKNFRKIKIKFIKLDYYPVLGIDPAKLIIGNRGNLSWTYIRNLENQIKDCDGIYMSDTYYFSCLQVINLSKKYKIPVFTEIWCTIPNHVSSWLPPYSYITKKVIENTSLFILRSNLSYKFTDSLKIPREKTVMIYK